MVNYRVDDLYALIAALEVEGCNIRRVAAVVSSAVLVVVSTQGMRTLTGSPCCTTT
jgi:hypothetical protein